MSCCGDYTGSLRSCHRTHLAYAGKRINYYYYYYYYRQHLGSFGIGGDLALQPMYTLSGGQKSRVAFAKVTFSKPHILLLDEPSNHLDLDAVNALIQVCCLTPRV